MSANAPEYDQNAVYYSAPVEKAVNSQQYYPNQPQQNNMQSSQPPQQVYVQPAQPPQQVYMQPAQPQFVQQTVYPQQGQQYVVAAPIQDGSDSTAFTLLIIGMCVPFLWFINACMYMGSLNPITKKYAKISLGLGIVQLFLIIAWIAVAASTSVTAYTYYNDGYTNTFTGRNYYYSY